MATIAPCGAASLLRSGIGPADDLRTLGIPAVVDLPGVESASTSRGGSETPDPATTTVPTVRDGEWVRFVIRFEMLDPARFREMAAAMVAVSRDEPGTVVYDWYADDATGTGALYEAYASPDALEAHGRGAVFAELAPRYADAVRVLSVDVFGEAASLPRGDVLGAPTTWWGATIAAVTAAG